MEKTKLQLLALLGLTEGTSDADMFKAVEVQKTQLGELKAQTEKLAAAAKAAEDEKVKLAAAGNDKVVVLTSELKTTREESVKLAARLTALEKEKADGAVTQLCEKLEREGRIIAADKERVGKLVSAMGLEEASKFAATWPVKVDLAERGHGNAGTEGDELTKAEAVKQFNAKVEELAAKEPSLKATQLYDRVKKANPDIAKAAFSARN